MMYSDCKVIYGRNLTTNKVEELGVNAPIPEGYERADYSEYRQQELREAREAKYYIVVDENGYLLYPFARDKEAAEGCLVKCKEQGHNYSIEVISYDEYQEIGI